MTDTPGKTAETSTPPKAPRKDQRTRGVWLTHYEDDDSDRQKSAALVTPHSSEIAALRDAVATGKTAVFVEFGKTIAEASK